MSKRAILIKVWRNRLDLRAQGIALITEGWGLKREASKGPYSSATMFAGQFKLHAEGEKLIAQGDRLVADGNFLWAEAILRLCGDVQTEWRSPTECRLPGAGLFTENL